MEWDGTTRTLDMIGPPTFDTWEACFDVYATVMLMLAARDLGSRTEYMDLPRRMHRRYGAMCWHIQYQAEARMRLEQLPRIYARGLRESAAASAQGGTHAYDRSGPWSWVFAQAHCRWRLFGFAL